MRFTIERNVLLRAMAQSQSVVERRNTIPILANTLIDARENEVFFRSTNLDVEVIDQVSATVDQPGTITVNAMMLHDIVRKLPDGAQIQLSWDGSAERLELKAGRSSFALSTLPKEDFPVMADAKYLVSFDIGSEELGRLLDKTRFAVSTEETRYYLNGVYLHKVDDAGGNKLRSVATDGHRLARLDVALPNGADEMPGVIIPRKAVNEIRKLVDHSEGTIRLSASETKIRFETGSTTLTSKVIDGSFPDYQRVIPSGNQKELRIDAAELAKAVDRVSTISSERSRAVKLTLDEDRVVLSVSAHDQGKAEEEVNVAYSDTPMEIGFNAKYLLEIADQIERENAVFFLNSPQDPALIQEGDDSSAVYVVMPMRI